MSAIFDDSSVSEYTISAGGVLAPIGSIRSGGSIRTLS
jgi:hypothetical protein